MLRRRERVCGRERERERERERGGGGGREKETSTINHFRLKTCSASFHPIQGT